MEKLITGHCYLSATDRIIIYCSKIELLLMYLITSIDAKYFDRINEIPELLPRAVRKIYSERVFTDSIAFRRDGLYG